MYDKRVTMGQAFDFSGGPHRVLTVTEIKVKERQVWFNDGTWSSLGPDGTFIWPKNYTLRRPAKAKPESKEEYHGQVKVGMVLKGLRSGLTLTVKSIEDRWAQTDLKSKLIALDAQNCIPAMGAYCLISSPEKQASEPEGVPDQGRPTVDNIQVGQIWGEPGRRKYRRKIHELNRDKQTLTYSFWDHENKASSPVPASIKDFVGVMPEMRLIGESSSLAEAVAPLQVLLEKREPKQDIDTWFAADAKRRAMQDQDVPGPYSKCTERYNFEAITPEERARYRYEKELKEGTKEDSRHEETAFTDYLYNGRAADRKLTALEDLRKGCTE